MLKRAFIIFSLPVLIGCHSSTIMTPSTSKEFIRLAATNQIAVISGPNLIGELEHTLGYQYLLVGIPFGRIRLQHPQSMLDNLVFEAVSLWGYRPVPAATTQQGLKRIEITIESASVNAYDFLVSRKVAAQASVMAKVYGADSKLISDIGGNGEYSKIVSMPFESELRHALRSAIADALNAIGQDIRSRRLLSELG